MDSTSSDVSLYPPLRSAAVVKIHEAGPERLVLDIPPGKHSSGLGCFAVIWNGFMVFVTGVVVITGRQQAMQGQEWMPILVISVFWLIGFGLTYAWARLRFERSFLLVERERAVLRKMFLGRNQQQELALDETSRAQLTESYQQNDVPIYRVTVIGNGGNPIHFGTSLDQADKNWCVDAINTLLQPQSMAVVAADSLESRVCEACDAVIPADAFRTRHGNLICPECEHEQSFSNPQEAETEITLPEELPGVVQILEDSSERLGLRLKLSEYPAVMGFIGLFGLGFSAIWFGLSGKEFLQRMQAILDGAPNGVFDWIGLVFMTPFLLAGAMPLVLTTLACCGRLTTWIDRETVRVRLHAGPIGKSWTMPTPEVTAVRLMDSREMPSRRDHPRFETSNPRVKASHEISKAAGIFAGSRMLAMTAIHQPLTARFVVRKVQTWLRTNIPELKV